MSVFNALYYPTWNPPADFFRAALLFFDRFEVIIPQDVPAGYDEANARVVELIPDAFLERRERQYNLDFDQEGWERFERALDLLVDQERPTNKIQIISEPGGVRRIGGHVFLHDAKLSDHIKHLLESRKLLRPELQVLAGDLRGKGFHVVDERATNLILSLLADNIAQKNLLRTITDEPIGYAVNALNAGQATSQAGVQAQLASSIITTEVPKDISSLTPQQYVELRKRFEPLRRSFQLAVRDLCDVHMLSMVRDRQTLDDKIRELSEGYHHEIEKLRKGGIRTALAEWTKFSVGVLGSTLGIPGVLSLSVLGAGLSFVVQIHDKLRPKQYEDAIERSQRLIAGLRSDLLAPRVLQKLSAR
jgi:hypothetical protein